jgi:hypothetical protein
MFALVAVALTCLPAPGEDVREELPLSLSQDPARPGEFRRRVNEIDQARSPMADAFGTWHSAPLPDARNAGWHSLFGTPPLEEAALVKARTWHARLSLDLHSTDWESDEGGGTGRYDAAMVTETLAVDYALTDRILVGARVSTGELGEGDERIVVHQDGVQLVPDGERGFGLDSASLRARYVHPAAYANVGVSLEAKIPLADEEDLLTSQTLDVALTLQVSRRWGRVTATANLGIVVPFGDPKVFDDHDEADPYVQGGAALAVLAHPNLSLVLQAEFNTAAFGDVDALNDPAFTALVGARAKITKSLFAQAGIGVGFTEASGDWLATAGLEYVY